MDPDRLFELGYLEIPRKLREEGVESLPTEHVV